MFRTVILAAAAMSAVTVTAQAQAQSCDAEPQFAAHRTANGIVRAQYNAVSRGEWVQAIHFGNEVAESGTSPRHKTAAATNLCAAYAATGEFASALEACNVALGYDDDAWRALNNRGVAQWLAGDRTAALTDFQAAAAVEADEDEVVANLALAQCS
ncbi:MAG: hypothetical protein GYB36_10060 [Alphaproteobacteria bacterium]|nr:hypothetical protein [Alphaproteobacteria bacterium]